MLKSTSGEYETAAQALRRTAGRATFREALKLNPDDFEANLYLGAILYKRRDMTEAKTYLDHALALKPDDLMRSFVGNELTC